MKVPKLVIGLSVAAVLGIGAVGIAGASTSSDHHHHIHGARLHRLEAQAAQVEAIAAAGKLPAAFKCSSASKDLVRISKAESLITAYLPKAEAREAAALAAGKKQRAHVIAHRIAEAQKLEAALVTVGGLITTACPS